MRPTTLSYGLLTAACGTLSAALTLSAGCARGEMVDPDPVVAASTPRVERSVSARREAYAFWMTIHTAIYSRKDFAAALTGCREYFDKFPPSAIQCAHYIAAAQVACVQGELDYSLEILDLGIERVGRGEYDNWNRNEANDPSLFALRKVREFISSHRSSRDDAALVAYYRAIREHDLRHLQRSEQVEVAQGIAKALLTKYQDSALADDFLLLAAKLDRWGLTAERQILRRIVSEFPNGSAAPEALKTLFGRTRGWPAQLRIAKEIYDRYPDTPEAADVQKSAAYLMVAYQNQTPRGELARLAARLTITSSRAFDEYPTLRWRCLSGGYDSIGALYLREGQADKALTYYAALAHLAPERFKPHVGMGMAYVQMGALTLAEESYRKGHKYARGLDCAEFYARKAESLAAQASKAKEAPTAP